LRIWEDGVNGPHFSLSERASDPLPDGCAVVAFGVVQVPQDAMPALRKQPGPDVGKTLSPRMLRQADEQAVAAVAAVFHAIHDFDLQDRSFTDWAVVAAPHFLGRSSVVTAMEKFQRQGPRVVSPLVSPYCSLHSVSAVLSVGLKSMGPNLGVGGGPGAAGDGLLAGLTILLEQAPPGVWLVLTAWDPEPALAAPAPDAGPPVCHAVALALTPIAESLTGFRLNYLPAITAGGPTEIEASSPGAVSLARFLAGSSTGRWACPLAGGGMMELTDQAGKPDCSPAPAARWAGAIR
jgi:hypothetical protein